MRSTLKYSLLSSMLAGSAFVDQAKAESWFGSCQAVKKSGFTKESPLTSIDINRFAGEWYEIDRDFEEVFWTG